MLSDKIIRGAFVISFIGHFLFLSVPAVHINSCPFDKSEDITIRVEVDEPPLLPKIDIMGEEKKLNEIVKTENQSEPKPAPGLRVTEAVIELSEKQAEEKTEIVNPDRQAMLRYQDMVKQRIEEARKYPYWAQKREIEGTTYINFAVLSDGSSKDVKITRSSGSRILDEEAVATIKRANPFPCVPKEINASFVQLDVGIVFRLH